MVSVRPVLVYDSPLPRLVPPVAAVYHSIVQPLGAVTLNTALLVPQYELLLGFVGFVGAGLSVTETFATAEH